MFYRVVVQAVILFGSKPWAVLEVMTITVEVTHISFLKQIMGNMTQRNTEGTWVTPASGEVLREYVMQTSATYIRRRQVTVEQWVDLRPIFEVCTQEQGFKRGGQHRRPWWIKEASDEVLGATRVDAYQEERIRQRW